MTEPTRLFRRSSWPETARVGEILRAETTGGLLLIAGAVIALVWSNSPWADAYADLREITVGPAALHLDLSLATWAADGLLAIFFFVAGLELKREFVAGDLRDPRRAALPVFAAMGGMAAPALIFALWNLGDGDALRGWAIPTATDIAFAVAVLAVIGTHLPAALRTFLLTLAVVDDLLAITIIAIFYTDELDLGALGLAVVPLILFGLLVQRRVTTPFLLLPLAVVTWALMHESGVHATVAGVLLAFTVPVAARRAQPGEVTGTAVEAPGLAEHLEHLIRPISAGVAVPIFAFFAAGVSVGGAGALVEAWTEPVALGVMSGLVIGKVVGITGATWLLSRFTRAELDDDLAWVDVIGLSLLAGIGFTVSLLIGELAFGPGTAADDVAKVAVLSGSLAAAALATVLLRARNRHYRRIAEAETRDDDGDGVPDVYQQGDSGGAPNR
ncbi:Na+/H+ antiporter NhaA [Nocardioides sp. R-C-SC26]|uniref:Na+/H+ antiporter NhaA n=1 Tax=Nocardioides sp. R-C-SC26 TaxID=2870414 RepID=UPI001E2A933F|nr:Na+/H+ antiporter NhaA [Nocardioides sp. R-C-SC26]